MSSLSSFTVLGTVMTLIRVNGEDEVGSVKAVGPQGDDLAELEPGHFMVRAKFQMQNQLL